MPRTIDLRFQGRDRVICAFELDGLVVDPGPTSCLDALLEGLESEPRALLLTHVHLDHAGVAGTLVRRFPRLRVHVDVRGAPHLVDPTALLESAARLYGDDMDRLWGDVEPVPEANVSPVADGDAVEGLRVAYTPGHASHHVAFLHEETGDAYVGDLAGISIPPASAVLPPTVPPDIDLEAWDRSLETILEWSPGRLLFAHFGADDDPPTRVHAVREALMRLGELSRHHGRDAFVAAVRELVAERAGGDEDAVVRYFEAAPPEQLWLGLERYWRKRAERAVPREGRQ